jgi:hypothetical protein
MSRWRPENAQAPILIGGAGAAALSQSHEQPDTTDAGDSIYKQAGGSSAPLKLTEQSAGDGFAGAITLGVKG